MMSAHGIDVIAYDSCIGEGGQITNGGEKAGNSKQRKNTAKEKKRKRGPDLNSKIFDDGFEIHSGGPKALKLKNMYKRALFLCYPDEDVMEDDTRDDSAQSMGAACLEHYKGNTVIHVGELYGDTPSMDQAPWGRSSGPEFQQRLASEYHCILRAKLNNWLHVNDTISVWKRTELCSIVFQGDEGDDESDDEVEYRHIPEDQRLPTDVAAPCVKHLL